MTLKLINNKSKYRYSILADDTQLFNKNDEPVKKSFDISTIYEKASGSKVNYEKTKIMYIGSAKNNRPKFTKIIWTKDNVKTLGIHHGYNIQNDEIWKSIIDKMKNCVHVWKSRNLTYVYRKNFNSEKFLDLSLWFPALKCGEYQKNT